MSTLCQSEKRGEKHQHMQQVDLNQLFSNFTQQNPQRTVGIGSTFNLHQLLNNWEKHSTTVIATAVLGIDQIYQCRLPDNLLLIIPDTQALP